MKSKEKHYRCAEGRPICQNEEPLKPEDLTDLRDDVTCPRCISVCVQHAKQYYQDYDSIHQGRHRKKDG